MNSKRRVKANLSVTINKMYQKKKPITEDGLQKLKEELNMLKTVRRREVAQAIQVAKEQGDLSENAEYVEAKDAQGLLEQRIVDLESLLKNAEIIQKDENGQINVGYTVKVNMDGKEFSYTIVGPNEAEPAKGKISNESPLGTALQGKKVGDVASVRTPVGVKQVKVLSVG